MFLLSEANIRFYSPVGTPTQLHWAVVYLPKPSVSDLPSAGPECLESPHPIVSVAFLQGRLLKFLPQHNLVPALRS